jgi:hypothetical protein
MLLWFVRMQDNDKMFKVNKERTWTKLLTAYKDLVLLLAMLLGLANRYSVVG